MQVVHDVDDDSEGGANITSKEVMSASFLMPVNEIDVHQLSSVIRNRIENVSFIILLVNMFYCNIFLYLVHELFWISTV